MTKMVGFCFMFKSSNIVWDIENHIVVYEIMARTEGFLYDVFYYF